MHNKIQIFNVRNNNVLTRIYKTRWVVLTVIILIHRKNMYFINILTIVFFFYFWNKNSVCIYWNAFHVNVISYNYTLFLSGWTIKAEIRACRDAGGWAFRWTNSMGEHGSVINRVFRLAAGWLLDIYWICVLPWSVCIQL